MNKQQAQQCIKDIFETTFDKSRFIGFARNLLNHIEDASFTYQGNYIPEKFRQYIKTLERIGKYSDGEQTLDILVITLQKETSLERARAIQRNFIAWYLNGSRGGEMKDAALVAYVSPDQADWRFSLVKMDYKFEKTKTGKMKVKEEFTPARRWSFLVGVNEKSHTAQSRLVKILADDEHAPTLAELEKAFDIETVTKEFFLKYRELFLRTKEALDKVVKKDSKVKADFDAQGVDTVNFAKKLLGQIVFLYFLQKKGWFGVGRDDDWGTGSKQFLRELFDKHKGNTGMPACDNNTDKNVCATKNFFNDILEPLFYEALRIDRSHDDDYYSRFNCKIPFLNGGLFDPIGNYDWVHTDINLPNDLFSNTRKTNEGDIGDGILDVFDRYNFTVREDEPLEKEVAIDPELLGKAYEKFNAIRPDNFDEFTKALKSGKKGEENKFNKKFGVYYTPREIVHYMCKQSLINYLHTKVTQAFLPVEITREDIEDLIEVGEMITEHEATALIKEQNIKNGIQKSTEYTGLLSDGIRQNAKIIDEWLADITVCDPAVGSGAFPVGMMNEIVRARNVLSVFLKGNTGILACETTTKTQTGMSVLRSSYEFKRRCIEHSLYGVDIDPGAVEIAKLRLWLSLVVDEEDIKNIKPLPNLDYKIVCGNSLLGVEKDLFNQQLFNDLEKLKPLYFNETNPTRKQEYKKQINDLISQITQCDTGIPACDKEKKPQTKMSVPRFDFEVYFSEVFHQKGGFDVVIANPPYGAELRAKDIIYFKSIFTIKTSETAILFIEKGYNLLKPNGVESYIIPKAFTFASNYSAIRDFTEKEITIIGDCGKAFEQVKLEASVIIINRGICSNEYLSVKFEDNQFFKVVGKIDKRLKAKFGFYLNGLTAQEIDLGIKICQDKLYLKDIASNSRGEILQKYIESHGDFKVVGGKEIDRYGIRGLKGYIDKKYIVGNKCRIHNNSILAQNIIAHITKPYDQIKIIACIPNVDDCVLTDTINQITVKESKYSQQIVWIILNSKLLNWFVYYFIFGKAIRTMHFDNAVTDRIPIPSITPVNQDIVNQIENLVDQILTAKKLNPNADTAQLEKQIDQLVYQLYDLTEEEIAIIEGKVK